MMHYLLAVFDGNKPHAVDRLVDTAPLSGS
jgi:hypothetical protein